jgi:Fe-S cluster assembly protein SufD
MSQVLQSDNVFVASFERLEPQWQAGGPPWLHRLRRTAVAHFAEAGFPTTRQEEWRFTDVSSLVKTPFEPAPPPSDRPTLREIEEALSAAADCPRIVLVDGRYAPELSRTLSGPDGVALRSLAGACRERADLVEPQLGRHAAYRTHPFVALNTAFIDDGAFIHVPPGAVVERPIHVLHVWTAAGDARVAHPRNLFMVGSGAEAKIVETYLGPDDNLYFTNVVTELVLEEGSTLQHYKLQREGSGAFHMGTVQVQQHRDCVFSSHLVSLGGSLVRNETNTFLAGEGCECVLNGLYLARGRQHVDCRTRIDHAKPHCQSRELYKGILDDRAKGVFNGKIFVHQDAQKTDAKQSNHTLLLSDHATINTKPQLEIFADDVKCTHGAAVGQLDEEALFYLQTRGIARQQARDLLIHAFANDVVGRIRVDSVRAEVERVLAAARRRPAETTGEEAA